MVHEGLRIKELLRINGYNQTDIGKMRSITKAAVSNELNREKLGPHILSWYSNLFGMSIEEMFKEETKEQNQKNMIELNTYLEVVEALHKAMGLLSQNNISFSFPTNNLGKTKVLSYAA